MFEQTAETDIILRNIGNLPIHIRQAQNWLFGQSSGKERSPAALIDCVQDTDYANNDSNFSVINEDDQNNEMKLVSDKE